MRLEPHLGHHTSAAEPIDGFDATRAVP
jgi:hypothetical protein